MLKIKKQITFIGESVVDGKVVATFSATMNGDNPEAMTIGQYLNDKDAYLKNATECRADRAQFEDAVWEAQAEMESAAK
jgi:hypothetical protein